MISPATQTRLDVGELDGFVRRNAALDSFEGDAPRREALAAVARAAAELAGDGSHRLVRELPARVGAAMEDFGWLWNGFYALGDDGALHVCSAHGPPVCATLERSGGPLTSGMCFDGILLNQTLSAYDAKDWPGYVSCDTATLKRDLRIAAAAAWCFQMPTMSFKRFTIRASKPFVSGCLRFRR